MNIDLAQLEQLLSELPSKIREAEKSYLISAEKLEREQLSYDVAYGVALVEAKAPNATEKKALATVQTAKERATMIEKKYEMKRAEAEWKYLHDKFVAMRKIASIETEMVKTNLSGV